MDGLDFVDAVLVPKRTGAGAHARWTGRVARRGDCGPTPVLPGRTDEDRFHSLHVGIDRRPEVIHTSGGYLLYASVTHRTVFDVHEDDVYFRRRLRLGLGHSYIVYGPLANGSTTVMFESTPLYPDASNYWKVVDDLSVAIFYTAPAAIGPSRAAATRSSRRTPAVRSRYSERWAA